MNIIVTAVFLIVYFNIVIWIHLNDVTNVYTFKDYWMYKGKINIVINISAILLVVISYLLSTLKHI